MRIARLVLFLSGACLFAVVLVRIGPGAITSAFASLSWRLLVILVFPFVLVTVFDTLGWRFAFRRDRARFTALLSARLAGEAFNATTPTASVGGEAVKAWLLRPSVPLGESLPSVVIAKTTITVSQALFLLFGIAVAWPILPSSHLLRAMEWLLIFEAIGVGGFVFVQLFGMASAWQILKRLGLDAGADRVRSFQHLDHGLAGFYREAPGRLCLSIGCHFLGWAFSALESYVILHALGVPVSLATATVIEAFGTGIRFASFMVPAHLGALEGGHVVIFQALGLGGPTGLAFTLVRRVREAAWTGLGFLVLLRGQAPDRSAAAIELEV
jgi:uncharacterized protein (TIRG00374 family)